MKKQICKMLAVMLAAGMLTGCGGQAKETGKMETEAAEGAENAEADKSSEAALKDTDGTEESKEEEGSKGAGTGGETELLIAAAASLKNAYEEELIPMFEAMYPGISVNGTYDSSGKLQTQIEEGLEADVFMSAAVKQMDALNEKGMIASETITDLLENKIVLIVPAGSGSGLETFEDIQKADMIALGDPASVPAGQYAKEALTSLGIWEEIQDKVSFGSNVTEVLNQVAAGSADAGIVYATDAASIADQVEVVAEAPEGSLSQKVIYPAAVVKNTAHEEEAKKFVDFLQTEEAMAVFEAYGFSAGK